MRLRRSPVAGAAPAGAPSALPRLDAATRRAAARAEATPNVADNTAHRASSRTADRRRHSPGVRRRDTSAGAVSVIRGDVLARGGFPRARDHHRFRREARGHRARSRTPSRNYVRTLAGYTPPSSYDAQRPAYPTRRPGVFRTPPVDQQYPTAKSWWIRNVRGRRRTAAWQSGYTGPKSPASTRCAQRAPLQGGGHRHRLLLEPSRQGRNIVAGSPDSTPADSLIRPWLPAEAPHGARLATVSHGMCVSGIVGAAVGNGEGTLGVANDTPVACLQGVLRRPRASPTTTSSPRFARPPTTAAEVINMSLAGGDYNAALQAAIDYAWNRGLRHRGGHRQRGCVRGVVPGGHG